MTNLPADAQRRSAPGHDGSARVWLPILVFGLLVPIAYVVMDQLEQRGILSSNRHPAADFDVARIDRPGERLTLAALKGRPLLLSFWASWCTVCKAELPLLLQLAEETKGGPGTMIGIATSDVETAAAATIAEAPRPFAIGFDQDSVMAGKYLVPGLPHTILIDSDGYVVKRYGRPLTPEDLPTIAAHLR